MSKKFEIINNSLVITDSIDGVLLDLPKNEVYYKHKELITYGYISLYATNTLIGKFDNIYKVLLSESVDSNDTPFTEATFIEYARNNLGFKNGGAGSVSGAILLTQQVDTYDDLVAGVNIGDIAYVENSQGTSWRLFGFGGNYYPSGHYLWDGTAWESDRKAIAEQLYLNKFKKVGFSAKNSTTTIPATSWTVLSFNNELEDTDNAFSTSTFTAPESGVYSISGVFVFASVADGNRYIVGLAVNSSSASYILGRGTAGSTSLQGVGGNVQIPLNEGDSIKLLVYCDNATSAFSQDGYQSFSAYKITR